MTRPKIYIEAERPSDQKPNSTPRIFARFWFRFPSREPYCTGSVMFDLETWDWLLPILMEKAEVEIDMVVEDEFNDE